MKSLFEVIKEHNLSDKEINPISKKNILLKRNIFYSVKLIPDSDRHIYLLKNWRWGIIGKVLFKKKHEEYIKFLDKVKSCLESHNFKFIQLNYFPNSKD
ncbi:hypothetical protein GCM10022260_05650 [Gaetbulibacter aestuarii]